MTNANSKTNPKSNTNKTNNQTLDNVALARVEVNLKVLEALRADDESLSIELINQYSGWGGLRDAIFTPSIYRELKKVANDAQITSIKLTTTNAYYTPDLIVKFMWATLDQIIGFKGGDILEPAVGLGVFLDFMPLKIKEASKIDAVELDHLTCEMLLFKHPKINLICGGFENLHCGAKQYNLIISNPPFGRERLTDIIFKDLSDLRIHHFFIAKAARMLKDNGIIAVVVPSYFLDNVTEHARDFISDSGVNLLMAFRLPDDLFSNAKVTIDIVFLQKAKTGISWTKTYDKIIENDKKPLNEYFIDHPEHIIGTLQVIPMYERTGITCRSNGDLREQLAKVFSKMKKILLEQNNK